jgi:mannose/fructose/N-acetylgalactosamine-specific phosphotransferase system component IID/mannose/fructose/N-acetylgalactosamine-specific phosphotransferase system component IIC
MHLRLRAAMLATAATMAAALAVMQLPGDVLAASATGAEISVTPLQAALIGIGYYMSYAPWWFGTSFLTLYRPLVAGLFVGIILGDPAQGALIGGAINLFYLGFLGAGGTIPSDPGLAGWLGTTIAIVGGLNYAEALAIAVPLGLLGTIVFYVRMTVDSAFAHLADRYAERGWLTGLTVANLVLPQIFLFAITFTPVFLAALKGVPFIVDVIHALPIWVLNGLAVAGGVLPAIGIAMNMRFIFRWPFIPYFFLGYFLIVASNGSLPIVIVAAIGLSVGALHVVFTERAKGSDAPEAARQAAAPAPALATEGGPRITRRDLHHSWLLWTFFSHANYNYERLQGTGFAHSMAPIIRRLYTAPEDIKAAMRRHLVFYNTEPVFGSAINGAVIAMEEQRANGADIDDEAINSVKTGLMGPLAGIGDSISQGTITPLLLALGISIAGVPTVVNGLPPDLASVTGNPLGPIVFLVLETVTLLVLGYVFWMQGYARGKSLIVDVLRGGVLDRVITGANVLGNLVLGALAATYVVLWIAPTITVGSATLAIQADILDKILPGLLPLVLVVGTWWLLRRRVNPLVLLVVYLVVALVGSYPFFGPEPTYVTDQCGSAIFQPYGPCPKPAATTQP